jgi:hypothetical protein
LEVWVWTHCERGLDGYPIGTDFLTDAAELFEAQGPEEVEMFFLFIIRRLNPRARAIVGATLTLAGLVLLGLAATVASWLVIHGAITTALGVAFCVAAYAGHKKAQAPQETVAPERPASLVNG